MSSAEPPKKKHKRSRGACMACKAMKKRCSEDKPSCVRCASYDTPIACVYAPPQKRTRSRSESAAAQNLSPPSPSPPVELQQQHISPSLAPLPLPQPPPAAAGGSVDALLWPSESPAGTSTAAERELLDSLAALSPSLFIGSWGDVDDANDQDGQGTSSSHSLDPLSTLASISPAPAAAATSLLGAGILPDTSPSSLLAYFASTMARTVVAEHDEDNFYLNVVPSLLSSAAGTAGIEQQEGEGSALLHASFSLSCVHAANLGRQSVRLGTLVDEEGQLVKLGQLAREHSKTALSLLRKAATREDGAAESVAELESRGSAVMMLVLQAMSSGDAKLIPSLLIAAEKPLLELHKLSPTSMSAAMIMLHSVYTIADRVGRQQPCDSLLWLKSPSATSGSLSAEKLLGASQEVFDLWRRIHNLTVSLSISSSSEDVWARIGVQQELDELDGLLSEKKAWEERWETRPRRVQLGNEAWRNGLRVFVLRVGFGVQRRDGRVQRCVEECVKALEEIPLGSEVGLSWPLILCGCEALGPTRNTFLQFSQRCQWRGSASSKVVETCLMAAWGAEGRRWQESFVEGGCPLVL